MHSKITVYSWWIGFLRIKTKKAALDVLLFSCNDTSNRFVPIKSIPLQPF